MPPSPIVDPSEEDVLSVTEAEVDLEMKPRPGIRERMKLFADDSLTKKASLNAVSIILDYGARLLVGFLTTPLLVMGLGQYFYGAWQVLNKLIGYLSPTSGRPTQALKWTIARDQASTDYEQKRKYVGSAFIVWILFMPLLVLLGTLLVWMAPHWLKAPLEHYWQIRVCTGLLVANLAVRSLATIPMSVLQGENLGYKRMGLTTSTVLLGGALVWLSMSLHTGLIGVSAAALATTVASGVVFFKITRTNAKWLKLSFPPFRQTRQFLGLSMWFLGWNLVMNLMTASDVVLLGLMNSAEAVTNYSLTKYVPETLISLIALLNIGITPGLGGIVGSGSYKKAADVRGEMMSITWLIATALGATILFWNRTFLGLWVGPAHYVGHLPALVVTLMVIQFVMIRVDAGIIDLSLDLRHKVLVGLGSAAAAVTISALFIGLLKWGILGLCLGMIAGRMLLTVGYPLIVGRFLKIGLWSQLRTSVRPLAVTILLLSISTALDSSLHWTRGTGLKGWVTLLGGAGLTAVAFLAATFYAGLTRAQRRQMLRRLHAVHSPAKSA